MTALCIIIGIIVFFLLILSIRININGEYFDTFKLNISWLFLKFPLFPMKKKEKRKKMSRRMIHRRRKKKKTKILPQTNQKIKKRIFL